MDSLGCTARVTRLSQWERLQDRNKNFYRREILIWIKEFVICGRDWRNKFRFNGLVSSCYTETSSSGNIMIRFYRSEEQE